MNFAFVRCISPSGVVGFMRVTAYDRHYRNDLFFKACKRDLVVFKYVYVACFPVIVSMDEILEHNPDAEIISKYYIDANIYQGSLVQACEICGFEYE